MFLAVCVWDQVGQGWSRTKAHVLLVEFIGGVAVFGFLSKRNKEGRTAHILMKKHVLFITSSVCSVSNNKMFVYLTYIWKADWHM